MEKTSFIFIFFTVFILGAENFNAANDKVDLETMKLAMKDINDYEVKALVNEIYNKIHSNLDSAIDYLQKNESDEQIIKLCEKAVKYIKHLLNKEQNKQAMDFLRLSAKFIRDTYVEQENKVPSNLIRSVSDLYDAYKNSINKIDEPYSLCREIISFIRAFKRLHCEKNKNDVSV